MLLFAEDTIHYSVMRTPTDFTQLQDDLRPHGILGKEVADVLYRKQMSPIDCHREKGQDLHQLDPPQLNP